MKHLWEESHEYYCNEGNYRSDDCGNDYETFEDFLAEWGDADLDYNLLFRWDWMDKDRANEEIDDEEDKYESDLLKLFWMLQRKGDYRYCVVKVNKEDEEKVIEFLKPRWDHIKTLWMPFE